MKKLALILLVATMGFFFLGSVEAADNILDNPGFEDGLGNWFDLYGVPSDLAIVGHSGDFSASKTVDPSIISTQDYWSEILQEQDFAAGEPAYTSMFIKTDFPPEATARAGIILQFINASDRVVGSVKSRTIGGVNDWRLLEVSSQSAPAGTVTARLSGFIWAARGDDLSLSGEADYDDAFLGKEFRIIPLQSQLLNAGFENGVNEWQDLYGFPTKLSTQPLRTGNYAAKKTIDQIPQQKDYWSTVYQEIACTGNKKVTASIFVQTDFVQRATSRAGLMLEFLDANNKALRNGKFTSVIGYTGSVWRKLAITVKKAPVSTAKVRFSMTIYTPNSGAALGKSAYYDDASLIIQ